MHVPFNARFFGAALHGNKIRNGDGRQDPDDRNDDHQLDQGEASLRSHVLYLHMWPTRLCGQIPDTTAALSKVATPVRESGILPCYSSLSGFEESKGCAKDLPRIGRGKALPWHHLRVGVPRRGGITASIRVRTLQRMGASVQ